MPTIDEILAAYPIGDGPHGTTFRRPRFELPAPDADELAERRRVCLAWLPKAFRGLDLDGPELARFVRGGQERVDAARRAFDEALERGPRARLGHVVLRGASGSGKSAIGAAWLRGRILAGSLDRPRFVPAIRLDGKRTMGDGREVAWEALAASADELVLDDLAAELFGAPEAGGVAAQRREAASRLLHARYDAARQNVITTPFDRKELARLYGDGVARRVYDGAAVVELGGAT